MKRDVGRAGIQGKVGTDELAGALGISRRTLFRELDRIRRLLLDCISRRVAATDIS
jgi:predicted DNA-binding transcriptional regulator YafY